MKIPDAFCQDKAKAFLKSQTFVKRNARMVSIINVFLTCLLLMTCSQIPGAAAQPI